MMSFFEQLAETRNAANRSIVFAFEARNILHRSRKSTYLTRCTSFRKLVIRSLLCTHSPTLVAHAPLSSLTHVYRDGHALRTQQADLELSHTGRRSRYYVRNQFLTTLIRPRYCCWWRESTMRRHCIIRQNSTKAVPNSRIHSWT